MRVLIINVCLRGGNARLLLPIGLGYIATAVHNAGYEVEILDIDRFRLSEQQVKRELTTREYDVVLMGCIVTGYRYVKQLSHVIREAHPDATIIAGNTVASSIPYHLLTKTDVDIAVVGEGDVTIVQLLRCLKAKGDLGKVEGVCFKDHGRIQSTSPRAPIDDLDSLPFVNWDLIDIKGYIEKGKDNVNEPCPIPFGERKVLSLCTSRGCPYSCTFCYHAFHGYRYRWRSPEDALEELQRMKKKYDANFVNFWDEITFFRTDWTSQFLDLLLEADLGIYWNAGSRGDLLNAKNAYLARKMQKAGCVGLTYSLESANAEILRAMNKRIKSEQIREHKKLMDEAGLASWVSIVVGYPQETEQTLQETFDFCERNRIYPSTGYLLPLPGTSLYEYALRNGFIKDEEEYLMRVADRQDLHVNMCQIPTERLQEIVHDRLMRLNIQMNLGLTEDSLVKTRHKRDHKKLCG